MNRFYRKIVPLLVGIGGVVGLLYYFDVKSYLTLEFVQSYSHVLSQKVERNYLGSVLVFIFALSGSTILGLPIAIPLILLSGYLYGTVLGAVYSIVAVTLGCTCTFLIFRYLIKDFLKERYRDQLAAFDGKMQGDDTLRYLVVLHYMSIVPFFLINMFAALTSISIGRFMLSVVIGSLPYFIYTFAGQQLSTIEKVSDIFSPSIIAAMALLVALVLAPTIIKIVRKKRQ